MSPWGPYAVIPTWTSVGTAECGPPQIGTTDMKVYCPQSTASTRRSRPCRPSLHSPCHAEQPGLACGFPPPAAISPDPVRLDRLSGGDARFGRGRQPVPVVLERDTGALDGLADDIGVGVVDVRLLRRRRCPNAHSSSAATTIPAPASPAAPPGPPESSPGPAIASFPKDGRYSAAFAPPSSANKSLTVSIIPFSSPFTPGVRISHPWQQ